MASKRQAPAVRPLHAALLRLQALAARGVQANRMAREVEVIVGEWRGVAGTDTSEMRGWLDELHEQLASGVADAEEQVSYVDPSEAAAAKQAQLTLAALVATRDAVARATQGL